MAPRRKKAEPTKKDPSARSTAAIFQDLDKLDEAEQEYSKPKEEKKKEYVEPEGSAEEDIANAAFPFNYIYRVQDFMNANMTVVHGVQVLVCGYFIQMLYLEREKFLGKDAMVILSVVFFNWVGVAICVILGIVKGKDESKRIPDFNYIHSLLLPALVNLLHYDPNWLLVNLGFNYFTIDSMNMFFNMFSCVGFFEIYRTEESILVTTAEFGQYAFIFFVLRYALNYINTDDESTGVSLKPLEIHLVCVLLVNILFNRELVNGVLPLTIFQKLIISVVIASFFTFPVVTIVPGILSILIFAGVFYGFTIFQLNPVLNDNAINWLINYVTKDSDRVFIISVWAGMTAVIIPVAFWFAHHFPLNTRRKFWHALVVVFLCFTPKILFDQVEFTLISLLGTIIVFVIIEALRYNKVSFLGEYLHETLQQFQDAKDIEGPLNLSYIYLLAGSTIPIVYDYLTNKDKVSIIRYSGLIALGVGDSLASIIGKRFGTIKWKGGDKTVQGTAAFITSVFGCFFAINYLLRNMDNYIPVTNWENLFVTVLLAGFLEGTSNINDNYLIPIFIPISYEILNKFYK
ncbi:Dolichol kinase [Candida viswanathii]|uniref:dolichol kinase n=1 Tax=Candida viswanathii TaxID=5486 RepID=A0A367YJ55_9ASCO|nr:Dolichol kinase [Candida viswanathii]